MFHECVGEQCWEQCRFRIDQSDRLVNSALMWRPIESFRPSCKQNLQINWQPDCELRCHVEAVQKERQWSFGLRVGCDVDDLELGCNIIEGMCYRGMHTYKITPTWTSIRVITSTETRVNYCILKVHTILYVPISSSDAQSLLELFLV